MAELTPHCVHIRQTMVTLNWSGGVIRCDDCGKDLDIWMSDQAKKILEGNDDSSRSYA